MTTAFPDMTCLPSCSAALECLSCPDSGGKALTTVKHVMGDSWVRLSHLIRETRQHQQEKEQRLVCMHEPLAAYHCCLLLGGGGEDMQIFKN